MGAAASREAARALQVTPKYHEPFVPSAKEQEQRSAAFFAHLRLLHRCRREFERCFDECCPAKQAQAFEWYPTNTLGDYADLDDRHRQCGLDGEPVATLEQLYDVAAHARPLFEAHVGGALRRFKTSKDAKLREAAGRATFEVAPLKPWDRATAKAKREHRGAGRGPTWLFDVVRGSLVCDTEETLATLCDALDDDGRVDIQRTKNRFTFPAFAGYRDLLCTVAVDVDSAVDGVEDPICHLCELQIHLAPLVRCDEDLNAKDAYDYFRAYFAAERNPNRPTTERLELLLSLPLDGDHGLDDAVAWVLAEKDDDPRALEHLDELLASVDEAHRCPAIRERIVAAVKRREGDDSLHYADALEALARTREDLGKSELAEPLLKKVLGIRSKKLPQNHALVASAMVRYADCLRDQAKYVAAEPVYRTRLAFAERGSGLLDGAAGAAAHDLAECLRLADKRTAALPLHRRALKIREDALGPDHAAVGESLAHLGDLLRSFGLSDRGKLDEAAACYERALKIREAAHGASHRVVAVTLHGYARVLARLHRVAEAEPFQPGQQKGDSTSLQRECSARARFGNSTHASSAPRDDRSSKDQPKRAENDRDRSL